MVGCLPRQRVALCQRNYHLKLEVLLFRTAPVLARQLSAAPSPQTIDADRILAGVFSPACPICAATVLPRRISEMNPVHRIAVVVLPVAAVLPPSTATSVMDVAAVLPPSTAAPGP